MCLTLTIRFYPDFGSDVDPVVEVSGDDTVGPEEVVGGLPLDGDAVVVLAGLAGDAVVADDVVVEALNLTLRNAEGKVLA
jgi:hypothetical protein